MSNVKVGDKVKSSSYCGTRTYTVVKVGDDWVLATCDDTPYDNFKWFLFVDKIELVEEQTKEESKFKVGDKVKVNKAKIVCKDFEGVTGTITRMFYDSDNDLCYNIAYDNCSQTAVECLDEIELVEEQTKEESKTMFTETTTKIKKVIDSESIGGAYVSIEPRFDDVSIVVGAKYKDRAGCYFSKGALQQLIEELTAVRDCMKD